MSSKRTKNLTDVEFKQLVERKINVVLLDELCSVNGQFNVFGDAEKRVLVYSVEDLIRIVELYKGEADEPLQSCDAGDSIKAWVTIKGVQFLTYAHWEYEIELISEAMKEE